MLLGDHNGRWASGKGKSALQLLKLEDGGGVSVSGLGQEANGGGPPSVCAIHDGYTTGRRRLGSVAEWFKALDLSHVIVLPNGRKSARVRTSPLPNAFLQI